MGQLGGGSGPWGAAGGGFGSLGGGVTPMMPAQQNFQQNQATMPNANAGPMAGGGTYNPMAATQGPANPLSRQISPDWQQTVNAGMQGGGRGPAMPGRLDSSQSAAPIGRAACRFTAVARTITSMRRKAGAATTPAW